MDGGQDAALHAVGSVDTGQKRHERSLSHRWRSLVLPLLAYGALGLLLTWPAVAHFATHVPGDSIDDPSLAWNLWWARHAFVDQPQNPFNVGWQFWPVGINLAFYTLTILNGLLGLPLQLALGLIPTYNLSLLSSFVLGGFGVYLLCIDVLGAVDKGRRKQGDKEIREHGNWEMGKLGNWSTGRWGAALPLAAFLGGTLYAFASSKMFYVALGQGNIASSQWIPFAALYMVRAARPGGRVHDAGMAALFLVLQSYAELTYASFLLIFALLVALWGLVRRLGNKEPGTRDQGRGRRGQRVASGPLAQGSFSQVSASRSLVPDTLSLIVRFLLIALLFLLGVTPILANMLPDLRAEGDFFTSGGGFSDLFSADLAGYVLPTQLHPMLGGFIRQVASDSAPRPDGSHFPVDKGQQIYVGYVALVLALIGLWRGRRSAEAWLWAVTALVFFALTLGPSLRIAGYDQGISLPFTWISRLPFFEGNRYPSRYSVMLLLCLAPLAALGFRIADFRLRIWRWSIFAVALGALLFEHLSVPLPLSDLRVPGLYQRVAAEPGDFALLEVPPGWRNGARVAGKMDTVIMQQLWNQTSHGKRVLGGNTSRNPEFKFQYFSEDPTLALLIALTNAADLPQHTALREALAARPITDWDRTRARDLAALLQIRYVMVHREKTPPETERALQQLLPLELVEEAGTLALYRVAGNLAAPRSYPLGDDTGRPVLAEGWSPPVGGAGVYAERPEVRLLLPLPPERTKVRLHGRSLVPNQQVSLVVNGREIASGLMPDQPGWLVLDVPSAPDRPPLSDVRLRFTKLVPVPELPPEHWAVGKTGVESPVSILARSAGEETGDFAHIYVNGVDLSPGERGYNLVALDPRDGGILGRGAFDTHSDPKAGFRLAAWVEGLPSGSIVVGAVRDEASMSLSEEAMAALKSLGVEMDLRGHFRWGHAFIGSIGAPSGSAVEALDGIRPAQVSVGLPASAPQIAAWLSDVAVGE
jgi:Interleukin-like EMT inducer